MNQAHLIDGMRATSGSFGGTLAAVRPDDPAAHVMRGLLKRNASANPAAGAAVRLGCANHAGEDNRNAGRMATGRAIQSGDGDLDGAGRGENLTRVPRVVSKPSKGLDTDSQMADSSCGWRFINSVIRAQYGTEAMSEPVENLVGREGQNKFILASQQKAATQRSGRLAQKTITPVPILRCKGKPVPFAEDAFLKPDTSRAGLARLRPAFREAGGTVTAGNASGRNAGTAALSFGFSGWYQAARPAAESPHRVDERGRRRARYHGYWAGASQPALKKAGLTLNDIDLIEQSETLATQALACIRACGPAADDLRINPNGGALALGHPLGMSGAHLRNTAAPERRARQKCYALVTMCVGVGQGCTVLIERI